MIIYLQEIHFCLCLLHVFAGYGAFGKKLLHPSPLKNCTDMRIVADSAGVLLLLGVAVYTITSKCSKANNEINNSCLLIFTFNSSSIR